jgi:DNA-directed RNA polymerase subunit RPC12/RpoP
MTGSSMGLIVILTWFGLVGGYVGKRKGSSFMMWFLISFCVPFIGLLTAVVYRNEGKELRRQCPDCGRVLMLEDTVCMKCGSELEFPQVAIAPAARASSRS